MRRKKGLLFLIILFIAVGFAALAASLEVNGVAWFFKNKLDVHFENINYLPYSVQANSIEIVDKTKVEFDVNFASPGDYIDFMVDVVNDGTADAMIEDIIPISLTEEQEKYLEYEVVYSTGKNIEKKHALAAGDKVTYRVTVKYIVPESEDDLLNEPLDLNLSYGVKYVRDDGTSVQFKTDATFLDGPSFNTKVKSMLSDSAYSDYSFKKSFLMDDKYKTSDNLVSVSSNGGETIYVWCDQKNNIIYYYSDAENVFTNVDASEMFSSLNVSNINLSDVNTSYTTNMSGMFKDNSLVSFIKCTGLDTSKVTNMSYMFQNCKKAARIDVSNFDTSNVTDMSYMFYSCIKLANIDVGNFDTSNVRALKYAFYDCRELEIIDVSKWEISNVDSFYSIFSGCEAVVTLDLGNWDTSSVTTMTYMFYDCNSLKNLDISSFDTSNVTSMAGMFAHCFAIEKIDLSSFDTKNVSNMNGMFQDSRLLTTIYVSSKFSTESLTNSNNMFINSDKIVGGNGTAYTVSYVNGSYARVDGKVYDSSTDTWKNDSSVKGYFTLKV